MAIHWDEGAGGVRMIDQSGLPSPLLAAPRAI